ncbi:MAG: 4-hydroxybenzoate octaprenyltransferase [Elusimicrobia bacterium]|nr:4-hydroxybenzoate octaprenyltransferase [Elusimicrobiota bacterium]
MTFLKTYADFIKVEHTLFSLPLFFAGALLAQHKWPTLKETFLIFLAGASARIVALVLNRIIDRPIDAKNPRTQDRHLISGKMKLWEAWLLATLALLLYLYAAWLLSDLCLKLSWIPLLGFFAYPYFKRLTKWTHVGLGLVWSLIPLAGFFAVKSSFDGIFPVVLLSLFSVFWLAGFDIIYATMDEEFDREMGVYSLPAAWGIPRALRLAGWFHLLAFVLIVFLYATFLSGPITVMLMGLLGVLLLVEYRMSNNVNFSFFQVNTIIGFVVLLMVLSGIKGL